MDADLLKSDDLLGKLDLNLTKFLKPAETSAKCKLNKNPRKEMIINLFKANKNDEGYRYVRGWWAFETSNEKIAVRIIFY